MPEDVDADADDRVRLLISGWEASLKWDEDDGLLSFAVLGLAPVSGSDTGPCASLEPGMKLLLGLLDVAAPVHIGLETAFLILISL